MSKLPGKIRLALIGAAVLLLIAACGQTPAVVLTLDSATAEVLRGADVQIEVTLTRTGGATADVVLAVTGLPANVTADFNPATLTGGTLTSTLTLTTEAAAAEGSYDLSVTATGAGVADTAGVTLDVNSLSVSGRVIAIFESPLVGVLVSSQGDTAVTGANGAFTLTGLSVPYDLSVWSSADEWVQIYEGLTADELLLAPVAGLSTPPGTTYGNSITGTLSGGVIPVGPNQTVMVCIEGLDGVAIGCDYVAPTESTYSIATQWFGSTTREARVHAVQIEHDINGRPVSYPGHASMDLTLADTVAAVADLDLGAALATTTVDVEIDSPVAIMATIGAVQLGPNLAVPLMLLNDPATTQEVLMPVIADATYTFAVAAAALQIGWQADVTGATSNVEVPGLPLLVTPADLATGVTATTEFTAANPTSGPMTFLWTADVGDLMIAVTTMEETHTIPDVSPYGLAVPGGADFDWQIVGHSGSSTEAGTSSVSEYWAFSMLISQSSPGLNGEGTFAITDGRDFSTAP